jgi:broad specificity phosphatase PhoE
VGSIYLIRHGQASFGADDYDVLSPIGIRQAEVVGAHLAQLGTRLDRSLSGDLRRQQHTANTALEQLRAAAIEVPALEIDAAFNEFKPPVKSGCGLPMKVRSSEGLIKPSPFRSLNLK